MRAIQACIVLTLYGIAKLCQWTYQACRARSAAKKEAARLADAQRAEDIRIVLNADAARNQFRNELLDAAQNSRLKNTINELFRPDAQVGDGGTADWIREFINGTLTGSNHFQKAQDKIRELNKILRSEILSNSDRALIDWLITDLQDALLRAGQRIN